MDIRTAFLWLAEALCERDLTLLSERTRVIAELPKWVFRESSGCPIYEASFESPAAGRAHHRKIRVAQMHSILSQTNVPAACGGA